MPEFKKVEALINRNTREKGIYMDDNEKIDTCIRYMISKKRS